MSTSIYNPLGPLALCSRMSNSMYMCTKDVCKVKRTLFGPPDDQVAKKFVQEELAKITATQSEKWNFDFKNETTLNADGIYQWRPATPQKTNRPVKIRPRPEEDLQELLYGEPQEIRPIPVPLFEEEEMKSPPKQSHKVRNQIKKPQRLITDFMLEKKRSTSDPSKKQDWAPMDRPAKVPRLNPPTTS